MLLRDRARAGRLAFLAALGLAGPASAERLGPRGQIASFQIDAPGAPRSVVVPRQGELAVGKLGAGAKTRTQLSGTLRVATEGDYLLIASGDGGAKLEVDGRILFEEPAPRVYYAAGDVVPVHLAAGDHPVRISLAKAQSFGLRAVSPDFRPTSALEWTTPSPAPADSNDLVVDVRPSFEPDGYRLELQIARPRSAPADLDRPVEVEVRGANGVLFSAAVGRLPYPRAEIRVTLPVIRLADIGSLVVTVRHAGL
ncbi:MAG: hypothetical protein EOP08_05005, partial [Proteobacteria bacterium]